jgi:dihydropteroate synthase
VVTGFFSRDHRNKRAGPTIVGVLNTTPDSFSDGGRFVRASGAGTPTRVDLEGALAAAKDLVAAGAHVIDVGGESTRPGAEEVPVQAEIERTEPVIVRLIEALDAPLSIDTRKAAVAERALRAGAVIVNDVSGLHHDPELAAVAADRGATVIIGHMCGTPATMQHAPHYDDVLDEVCRELEESLELGRAAGLGDAQLVVDPGLGFGKRAEDNLALIAGVGRIRERFGLPVMLGPSRKSFLGKLTGDPAAQRDVATAAACAVAAYLGADALRVHEPAGAGSAAAIGCALRAAAKGLSA